MNRSIAAVLAAVLITAGCGVRPTGIVEAGGKPLVRGETEAVTVYLVNEGRLRAVTRPGLPGHPYLPVAQLTVRPTPAEIRRHLETHVPGSLQPLPGIGAVELQIRVVPGSWPALSRWRRTAIAQVVCTADAIPGVESVVLWDPREQDTMRRVCNDFADLVG